MTVRESLLQPVSTHSKSQGDQVRTLTQHHEQLASLLRTGVQTQVLTRIISTNCRLFRPIFPQQLAGPGTTCMRSLSTSTWNLVPYAPPHQALAALGTALFYASFNRHTWFREHRKLSLHLCPEAGAGAAAGLQRRGGGTDGCPTFTPSATYCRLRRCMTAVKSIFVETIKSQFLLTKTRT